MMFEMPDRKAEESWETYQHRVIGEVSAVIVRMYLAAKPYPQCQAKFDSKQDAFNKCVCERFKLRDKRSKHLCVCGHARGEHPFDMTFLNLRMGR